MRIIDISAKSSLHPKDLCNNEGKAVKAMSVDELRASNHFGNYTEDELVEMINTVKTFTEIVFSAWSKEETSHLQDSSTIIPLQTQQQKAA